MTKESITTKFGHAPSLALLKFFKFAAPIFLMIICIDLSGCSDDKMDQTDAGDQNTEDFSNESDELLNTDYNILFIGNSLTYTNELPKLLKAFAEKKDIIIGIKTIARANYALLDHWDDGNIQKEIATEQYDFVVVQQGPSSQAFGRQVLIEYGAKIKKECDKGGAQLAYFMVWPSREYYHTFEGVITSHELAAEANQALLCPVGRVWKEYFDSTDNFDYYGGDGFHPSLKGSQVAAQVIFNSLFE